MLNDKININNLVISSRHSDSIRAGPSGDRIPLEARFSATVQTDSGAHPSSYTVRTTISVVKKARAWRQQPTPSRAEAKERLELYLCFPSVPSWQVKGLTLPLLPRTKQIIMSSCDLCRHVCTHVTRFYFL
jgi:hypothetical protein